MLNVLDAKSVVLVSTEELAATLERLRSAIPELEELVHAYSPADPRRLDLETTIVGAKRAEEWLTTYVEPWELHRREMETLGDPFAEGVR